MPTGNGAADASGAGLAIRHPSARVSQKWYPTWNVWVTFSKTWTFHPSPM